MLNLSDNLSQSIAALRAHKLRSALTMLGLTMGVATLITVITIVEGANLYVEQKIANLGTNVFRVARTPFVVTDFNVIIKALKYKKIEIGDVEAIAPQCEHCSAVGASASTSVRVRYNNNELADINLYGHTANMSVVDTRTVEQGRYFTESEDTRSANVCIVGAMLVEQFFPSQNPLGHVVKVGKDEFTVVGTFEKIGSILGQDQDNFLIIPMQSYLRQRGMHTAVTIQVQALGGERILETAQDEIRLALRARRHVRPAMDDDFFMATNETYMSLWASISGAFFAVFVMVSAISAIVGGIVIMNVMLVSVTERTKEIGVRRAMGATQRDIRGQFLVESVIQCLVGGLIGIGIGFVCATMLRQFTSFPASVRLSVAFGGMALSSVIGLFFGIYPAVQASKLDPVVALRAD